MRVISGLDQAPILLSGEKWPDYRGALQELRRVRTRLHCEADDAVVVVWGPEEDCLTAADEIRLRYVDAVGGVPNETRQPFEDGSTDFERILPGPDRMYPDTDSPPTRVTRERVAGLQANLAEEPWKREARYAAVGVPGGDRLLPDPPGDAALVDRVVAECGANLRQACFLFGERLVGLRRAGSRSTRFRRTRWCEFFRAVAERPVLFEARDLWCGVWRKPRRQSLGRSSRNMDLMKPPGTGVATVLQRVAEAAQAAYRKDSGLVRRLAMGRLMMVCWARCRHARWRRPAKPDGGNAMSASAGRTEGIQGEGAAPGSAELGLRVWSEVRLTNDAGSVFEGVILPRSETLDDEHIVIKMKNGYNVGVHLRPCGRGRRSSGTRKRSTRFRRRNFRSSRTCPG